MSNDTKVKLKLVGMTVGGYLIILVALFFVAWLQSKLINTAIILGAYLSTRWLFPTTYHASSDKGCITFSCACFSIAIIITLLINISIMASVIIGATISLVLFILQRLIEINKERDKINIYALNEQEIRSLCHEKGLSSIYTQFCVLSVVEELCGQELYNRMGYSERQCKRIRKAIETKLNTSFKR